MNGPDSLEILEARTDDAWGKYSAWRTTVATLEAHREAGCVDNHLALTIRAAKVQEAEAKSRHKSLAEELRVALESKTLDPWADDEPTYVGEPPAPEVQCGCDAVRRLLGLSCSPQVYFGGSELP